MLQVLLQVAESQPSAVVVVVAGSTAAAAVVAAARAVRPAAGSMAAAAATAKLRPNYCRCCCRAIVAQCQRATVALWPMWRRRPPTRCRSWPANSRGPNFPEIFGGSNISENFGPSWQQVAILPIFSKKKTPGFFP